MTTPTTPAAVTVANTLAAHPDGITTRALADASGVSASTVAKTLTAMETDGTATRTPGPANGNRKPADIWSPVTPAVDDSPADDSPADDSPADDSPADEFPEDEFPVDDSPADEFPADEFPADDSPVDDSPVDDSPADDSPVDDSPADDSPVDDSPADETPADDSPADETPADDSPADETPADETPADDSPADDSPAAVAPVSGAPVGPRQPDLKVLIMAGVLGGHPDGITADAAINESGLSVAMGDTILAAMEVTGAARRLPTEADGTELWVPIADADLSKVDPANAPTHTTCPTCGHTRKVRRPSARRAAASGTGRTTGEINTDGSAKLGKNGLRNQVEAFMRDLGTGHDVTPGTVARELGGRSSGAVANAMARLTEPGVLVMTSEAPVRYALAETAPAPTADVVAFMTRPLTDDEPTTDEATDAAPAGDAASADDTTATDTTATDTTATDADADDEAAAAPIAA